METLLDKIMNVLTRYDDITPTQEPFVRKELEEVVKQFEQADGIVRRLSGKLNWYELEELKALSEAYTQSHPAQFGEKKEGGDQNG